MYCDIKGQTWIIAIKYHHSLFKHGFALQLMLIVKAVTCKNFKRSNYG